MAGHGGQADRRCRSRLRRDDDPAPPGRDRHGASPNCATARTNSCGGSRRKSSSSSSRRSRPCGWRSASRCRHRAPAPTQTHRRPTRRPHAHACRGTSHVVTCTMSRGAMTDEAHRFSQPSLFAGTLLPRACLAGQAPGAASAPDIPVSHQRPRLCGRAVLQHRLGHRPGRQHSCSASSGSAIPQPGNLSPLYRARCWCTAWASRPTADAGRRLDRLELGDLHRHRDQRGQAHDLCRPLAARGLLHAGRQGGLGHGARRRLCLGDRRRDLRGEDPHQTCRTARACRSSRRTASTAMSARRSRRRRW